MPNQSLLYTGRVLACSQLPAMMHIARELCGGQICVTPDSATFAAPETGAVAGEVLLASTSDWTAEDRRKLLAFARDLLNSDYAGHRLTFQLFAQSPPFAHLAAVYRNFDCRRAAATSSSAPRGCPRASATQQRAHDDDAPPHPALQHAGHLSRAAPRQRPLPGRGRRQHDLPARAGRRRISTRARVGRRSATPAGQAERAMDNIELLLARVRRARSPTSASAPST